MSVIPASSQRLSCPVTMIKEETRMDLKQKETAKIGSMKAVFQICDLNNESV
jgi:hypothetical protein